MDISSLLRLVTGLVAGVSCLTQSVKNSGDLSTDRVSGEQEYNPTLILEKLNRMEAQMKTMTSEILALKDFKLNTKVIALKDENSKLNNQMINLKKEVSLLKNAITKTNIHSNDMIHKGVEASPQSEKSVSKKDNINHVRAAEKVSKNQQNHILMDSPENPSAMKANNIIGFTAYPSVEKVYNNGDTVMFDVTVSNYGSYYDITTSTFECPTAGYYLFTLSITSLLTQHMHAAIFLDSVRLVVARADDNYDVYGGNTVVILCGEGQIVKVQCTQDGNGMYGGDFNTFSGVFLGLA